MRLIKWKPEVKAEKDNAFKGIEEMPRWHWWLEIVGYTASLLVIGEFILRLFS